MAICEAHVKVFMYQIIRKEKGKKAAQEHFTTVLNQCLNWLLQLLLDLRMIFMQKVKLKFAS